MIGLGTLAIDTATAILETRRKVRILAEELALDEVDATRIATAISNLSRMADRGRGGLDVAILPESGALQLILPWRLGQPVPSAATSVFHGASLRDGAQDDQGPRLVLSRFARSRRLPALDDEHLAAIRLHLRKQSRAELLASLKQQNDALAAHHAELEETVRKRTQELTDAMEAAEAANHAKSDFLSSMSHELRTPLNGVLGYAQILLRDDAATEEQKGNLNAIQSCGEHLLSLINDVLDLSKIEAGQLDIALGPCDLRRLIQEVADIITPRAQEKGLKVVVSVDHAVPSGISTDSTKLKQVLINLMGNSAKFTDTGHLGLTVTVQPGPLVTSPDLLVLAIDDSGIGMTPEELAHIFDPFKQAEGGKTSGGTGLGLAISQRVVEALEGTIEVRSDKGVGTCFTLKLPIIEVAGAVMADQAQGDALYTDPLLAEGQAYRVLVVDDKAANREILVKLLERAGFGTQIAEDGVEAVAISAKMSFDIILMDIRMPRMDGLEATRHIRQRMSMAELPVIAVTASVAPEFKSQLVARGMNDLISKPYHVSEVFRKLEQYLGAVYELRETPGAPPGSEDVEATPEVEDIALDSATAAQVAAVIIEACELGDFMAIETAADAVIAARAPRLGSEIRALGDAFEFDALLEIAKSMVSE